MPLQTQDLQNLNTPPVDLNEITLNAIAEAVIPILQTQGGETQGFVTVERLSDAVSTFTFSSGSDAPDNNTVVSTRNQIYFQETDPLTPYVSIGNNDWTQLTSEENNTLQFQYTTDPTDPNAWSDTQVPGSTHYRFRVGESGYSLAIQLVRSVDVGDPDDIIQVYARIPSNVPNESAGTLSGNSIADYTPTSPWELDIPDGTDPLWVQVIWLIYPGTVMARGIYNIDGLTEAEVTALLANYRTATQITAEIQAAITGGGDSDDVIEVYTRSSTMPAQAAGTLNGDSIADYTPASPWELDIPDGEETLWIQVVLLTYPSSLRTRGIYNISGFTEAEVNELINTALTNYRTATQITSEIQAAITGGGDSDDIIEVYSRSSTMPAQASGVLSGDSISDYTPASPWGLDIPSGDDTLWVQVISLVYPSTSTVRGIYDISGFTEAEVNGLINTALTNYRTAQQITAEITNAVATGLGAARVRSHFIAESAVLGVTPITGVLSSIGWTLQSGAPSGFDANGGRIFVPPLTPGSPNNSVNGFIAVLRVDDVDVDEVFIPWGLASSHSSQALNNFSLLADPTTGNNLDVRYEFEESIGYVLTLIGNGTALSPNTRVRVYLAQAGSGDTTGEPSPFRGTYNNTTIYDIGEYVNLGQRLFFSFTTNNVGNDPATDDGTNWHELESDTTPFRGTYSDSTVYAVGDYVNVGSNLYFSLVNGNEDNAPATDDGSNWRLLPIDTDTTPFRGTYSDSTVYAVGDYVNVGSNLYFSLVNGNEDNAPATDDGSNWRLLPIDTDTTPFRGTYSDSTVYAVGDYVNVGIRIFFSLVNGNEDNDPATDDGTNWREVGRAERVIHVYDMSDTPYEIGHLVYVIADRVFYYVRANTQQIIQIPRDNPADFTPTFAAGVADLVPTTINGVTFDVLQAENETLIDTAEIGDEDYLVGLGDGTFRVEAATFTLHIPSQSFNGNFWAIKQIEAPLLGIRAGIQILINGANPQYIWESAVIDLSGGMGQIFNLNIDRVGPSVFNLVQGDIISFRRWDTAPNPGDILISFPVSDPARRTLLLTFDATNPSTNPYWDIERGVAGFRLPDGTFIPVIDLDGLPDENSALEAFIHGFAHSVRFIFANFESESAITDPTGTYDHETTTLTLDPPYTDDESTLNDDGLRVTRLAILKRNDTLLFSNYVVTSNSDEVHHDELASDLAQRFDAPGFALDSFPNFMVWSVSRAYNGEADVQLAQLSFIDVDANAEIGTAVDISSSDNGLISLREVLGLVEAIRGNVTGEIQVTVEQVYAQLIGDLVGSDNTDGPLTIDGGSTGVLHLATSQARGEIQWDSVAPNGLPLIAERGGEVAMTADTPGGSRVAYIYTSRLSHESNSFFRGGDGNTYPAEDLRHSGFQFTPNGGYRYPSSGRDSSGDELELTTLGFFAEPNGSNANWEVWYGDYIQDRNNGQHLPHNPSDVGISVQNSDFGDIFYSNNIPSASRAAFYDSVIGKSWNNLLSGFVLRNFIIASLDTDSENFQYTTIARRSNSPPALLSTAGTWDRTTYTPPTDWIDLSVNALPTGSNSLYIAHVELRPDSTVNNSAVIPLTTDPDTQQWKAYVANESTLAGDYRTDEGIAYVANTFDDGSGNTPATNPNFAPIYVEGIARKPERVDNAAFTFRFGVTEGDPISFDQRHAGIWVPNAEGTAFTLTAVSDTLNFNATDESIRLQRLNTGTSRYRTNSVQLNIQKNDDPPITLAENSSSFHSDRYHAYTLNLTGVARSISFVEGDTIRFTVTTNPTVAIDLFVVQYLNAEIGGTQTAEFGHTVQSLITPSNQWGFQFDGIFYPVLTVDGRMPLNGNLFAQIQALTELVRSTLDYWEENEITPIHHARVFNDKLIIARIEDDGVLLPTDPNNLNWIHINAERLTGLGHTSISDLTYTAAHFRWNTSSRSFVFSEGFDFAPGTGVATLTAEDFDATLPVIDANYPHHHAIRLYNHTGQDQTAEYVRLSYSINGVPTEYAISAPGEIVVPTGGYRLIELFADSLDIELERGDTLEFVFSTSIIETDSFYIEGDRFVIFIADAEFSYEEGAELEVANDGDIAVIDPVTQQKVDIANKQGELFGPTIDQLKLGLNATWVQGLPVTAGEIVHYGDLDWDVLQDDDGTGEPPPLNNHFRVRGAGYLGNNRHPFDGIHGRIVFDSVPWSDPLRSQYTPFIGSEGILSYDSENQRLTCLVPQLTVELPIESGSQNMQRTTLVSYFGDTMGVDRLLFQRRKNSEDWSTYLLAPNIVNPITISDPGIEYTMTGGSQQIHLVEGDTLQFRYMTNVTEHPNNGFTIVPDLNLILSLTGRRADGIRFEVDNDKIEFIDIEDNTRNENVFTPTLELDTSHGVGTSLATLPADFMNYKEIHTYIVEGVNAYFPLIIDVGILERLGNGDAIIQISFGESFIDRVFDWTEDTRQLQLDTAKTWGWVELRS